MAFTVAANAEIVCTQHQGCWETHKRVRLTGGVYRGLSHRIPARENTNVYQDRQLPYANDFPARSPQDQR
jgi:hypothetical protein